MTHSTTHTLTFSTVEAMTHAAYLITFPSRRTSLARKVWIPRSQCGLDEKNKELTDVPEWLVKKNDLWDWSV